MREAFLLEDMFNTLITLEQLGSSLYSDLAKSNENTEYFEIYDGLAKDEKKHEVLYTEMKKNCINFKSSELSEEYFDYIKNLLDSISVVKKMSRKNIKTKSKKEVLTLALELEKETIFFLHEMKICIIDTNNVIKSMINEEKTHIVKIARMIQELEN